MYYLGSIRQIDIHQALFNVGACIPVFAGDINCHEYISLQCSQTNKRDENERIVVFVICTVFGAGHDSRIVDMTILHISASAFD